MYKNLIINLGMLFLLVIPCVCHGDSTYAATAQAEDLLLLIQNNHFTSTGISSNVGLNLGNNDPPTISGMGVDQDGTFRIGSQSKMFVGSAILLMVDKGYFSLTDTLGDLQKKYDVDLGVSELPDGAESITVEQLLNMSSQVPNYMGSTRSGSTSTLWDEWIAADYGSLSPEVTHTELAALGLSNYPEVASSPWEGTYSNTNAVILSLIGEAAYAAKTNTNATIADILNELVFTPAEMNATYLAMDSNATDIIGSEAGKEITEMDPTIPWASGAVVSTVEDQLKWIQILQTNTLSNGTSFLPEELFAARTDLANSTLISMGGIPLWYGYNVFTLDFTGSGVPLSLIGHGGSIAGYSSFSAWYQQLNLGLVVNVPSLTTIDKNGVYTITPCEILLMDLIRGMERLYRSDGSLNANLSGVSAGTYGGYTSFDSIITNATNSTSFLVEASGRTTSYLDLTLIDVIGNPIVTTIDPTLTYYTNSTGTAAVVLTSGVNGTVADNARAEAYGPETSVFSIQSGASLDLYGEVGAYGDAASAIVVQNQASLNTAEDSLAYMQGGNGSAISVESGADTVTIGGTAAVLGPSAALRVDNSTVTVTDTGKLAAVTTSRSMNATFHTVSEDTHAVYGAVLENNAVLDLYGTTQATAVYAWDGETITQGEYISDASDMPGVLAVGVSMQNSTANIYGLVSSTGYGVEMRDGSSNTLNINGGAVAGTLYSIKGGSGDDTVLLSNGGLLDGNIDLGGGNNSLTVSDGYLILDLDEGAGIANADTLEFSSTIWIDPGLSGVLGDANYTLASGVTTYAGSAVILNDMNPITFSLSHDGTDVRLYSSRDWTYYADNISNNDLGSTLDTMAAAAVQNTLSPTGTSLIAALDRSDTPAGAAAQLQPHTTNGLALALVRQTPDVHRALQHQYHIPTREERGWFAFGRLHGHFGHQNGNGEAADGYDIYGNGMALGGGRNFSPHLQFGLFLDYGTETQDFSSTGDMDDTILRMGPFMRWSSGTTTWSTAISVATHDVSSTRNVPWLNESNDADFNMRDAMVSTSLAHSFHVGNLELEPLVEGVFMILDSDSYKEDGGISALSVDSQQSKYLASTAGLQLSRTFHLGTATLTPRLGMAWWHQWLNRPDINAAFRSDPAYSFSTTGAKTDQDLLRLNADLDLEINSGLHFKVKYSRYNGASMYDNNVLALSFDFAF
ncbi:autotransporter domain-containing protein [Desulfoplanes formicivorans]|nr:autotransporter domain-containing protein [Desulfoplanes formicivorans]